MINLTRRVSLKQIIKLQLEGEKCRNCGVFKNLYFFKVTQRVTSSLNQKALFILFTPKIYELNGNIK